MTMGHALATLVLVGLLIAPLGVAPAGAVPADARGPAGPSAPTASPAVGALAQQDCSFPYTATDATGTETTLDASPERVVTLAPSAAQTMWEIGARDTVVGVTKFASYLEGADGRANVSQGLGVNVERIIGLDPDLVLAPNVTYPTYATEIAQFRDAGIPVYVFAEADSLEFVVEKTRLTGRLTGHCDGADATAEEMRTNLSRIRAAVDREVGGVAERPVGLYYTFGFTAGEGTFIDSIVDTAGLENGALRFGFYQLSQERVVEIDPDWLILGTDAPVPRTPAFNATTAVQEGRIVRVNTNYLNQPAPRTVRAVATILRTVHPETWEAVRADQETTTVETTTARTTTAETTTARTTTAETTTEPTESTGTTESTGQPGFALGLAALAVVGAALLAARRS